MTLGQMCVALFGAMLVLVLIASGIVMFAASVNARHKMVEPTCYVIMTDAELDWLRNDDPDVQRNRVTLENFFALQARRMMRGRPVSFKKGCEDAAP